MPGVYVLIMVTGAAGFIGAALTIGLLGRGDEVIGIDNLNPYYDVQLKRDRLASIRALPDASSRFCFHEVDIVDRDRLAHIFRTTPPHRVVHLAAQAGVRHSLSDPYAYADTNLNGFLNVLENCRHHGVEHLIYASSSSVYGANPKLPFSVQDNTDHPLSLYAATKKANELMAHCYSHLYSLPTTGLRFFTVYGPWGRPDMALFRFTRQILAGEPINVFNYGRHRRAFTYIDDIIEGVMRVVDRTTEANARLSEPPCDPASRHARYRIYNIGNDQSTDLERYILVLEQCLGRKSKRNMLPLQPGDIADTAADIDTLIAELDYHPKTPIEQGIARFVDWYKDYYRVR